MSDARTRTSFEERLRLIDLDPILYKLVVAEDGPRWALNAAKETERWYRRYHILFLQFPKSMIVPTKEVDEFWHHHILDTKKYFDDCMFLHGRMIHHFPYLGLRGDDDRRRLKNSFQNTLDLCVSVFGQSPLGHINPVGSTNEAAVVCGGNCSEDSEVECPNFLIRPSIRDYYQDLALN